MNAEGEGDMTVQRRFGDVAQEKGYVSAEKLEQALRRQAELSRGGQPAGFVGAILVDLGFMSEKQVLDVLNALHCHHPST